MTDVLRRFYELPILVELAGDIDIATAATRGDRLCEVMEFTGGGLVVDTRRRAGMSPSQRVG